jgi:hypothetical protein
LIEHLFYSVSVGMNRSRRDTWPPYQPTRHVLVRRTDYRYARPWQGFIIDWKLTGKHWEALVAFADDTQDGSPVVHRWFPADRLRPCHPNPNTPRDDPY